MTPDVVTRLRDRAARKWPGEADRSASLFGDAADEIERLRADAARYRWLAAHARSTAEHWGGRWSLVIDGPAPRRHDEEDALDEAVDAAMQAHRERHNARVTGPQQAAQE